MDDGNDELVALADGAQEEILASSSRVTTDQVVHLVETEISRQLSPEERRFITKTLACHPRLVPAALGLGMWKRGHNQGSPKRDFIGMGRR